MTEIWTEQEKRKQVKNIPLNQEHVTSVDVSVTEYSHGCLENHWNVQSVHVRLFLSSCTTCKDNQHNKEWRNQYNSLQRQKDNKTHFLKENMQVVYGFTFVSLLCNQTEKVCD